MEGTTDELDDGVFFHSVWGCEEAAMAFNGGSIDLNCVSTQTFAFADGAAALRLAQKVVMPETPCHGDIFHIQPLVQTSFQSSR